MSLNSAGANTDKVAVSNLQALGSGSEFTWFQWLMRTGTLASSQGMSIVGTLTNDLFTFQSPNMTCNIARATTHADATTATNPALNTWEFWASTYNETDGVRFFQGGLNFAVAEVSYVSRNVGVGVTQTDASPVLYVNNRGAANVLSFPMSVAAFGYFDRWMSLTELVRQQFAPRPDRNCRFFSLFGQGEIAASDLSGRGNNGVPTGMTIGAPITATRMPSPYDRFDRPPPPQLIMI